MPVGCGLQDADRCAEIKAHLAACQVETSIPDAAQCSPDVLESHEAVMGSDCASLQAGKADWWAMNGCEAGTVKCYGLFCCSVPTLQDGDLVFQKSHTAQSEALRMVLEASSTVRLTAFDTFATKGALVVKRLSTPVPDVVRVEMIQLGKSYLGRPYDVYFRWDEARLYCSERVFKLYERAAGIEIGTVEKFSDFNLSSPEVQSLIKQRYGNNPVPMDEPVVTPASMYEDSQLATVF